MQAGAICRCNNLIALLERQSQWFLDQNMLSLFHRFNCLTRVKSMGRRDVDGLNRLIPARIMNDPASPSPAIPSRIGGCAAWAVVSMFMKPCATPVDLEQRAERAVEEHEVIESYGASRQPPI